MDEAHLLGRGGLQLIAFEQHLQRVRRRHQPRDALRAPAARKEADLDFGQADASLVAVRGDPVVAGERQFEAAAHANPADGHGDGLAAGFQPPIDEVQSLRPLDEGAHRRVLAFGLGAADEFVARDLEECEVGAADALRQRDDGALDRGVARDLVDDLAELGHDFGIDDVHRAAGHVPGHERNAVGVGLETKILEFHGKSPSQAVRRAR